MRAARVLVAGAGALAGGGAAYGLLRRRSQVRGSTAERTVTVEGSAGDLYALWRDFANAPKFMERVHAVETVGDRHTHWVGKTPGGAPAEWDAELTENRPGELIAWRAAPPGPSGHVAFTPATGGRGTRVRLTLVAPVAPGVVERLAAEDLRRFKRLAETGEIATVAGQPSGKRSPIGRVLAGRRERSRA